LPFDFPNTPSNGQQIAGPNGGIYQWSASRGLWTIVAGSALGNASANNVGRNYVHNARFDVAQRGGGPYTQAIGYNYTLIDRWRTSGANDSFSFTQTQLSNANRAQIGDERAQSCLWNVFTGSAAAGSWHSIQHPIEWLWTLAGKTVTLSFWAQADRSLKLGVNLYLNPGSGGSPSAPGWAQPTGAVFNLTTAWQRFVYTFNVPSMAGVTRGTNGDDSTVIVFTYSCDPGFNIAAQLGNPGVQTGAVGLYGVQLEQGTTASPLDPISYADDFRHCLRFYQRNGTLYGLVTNASMIAVNWTPLVQMRAMPSVNMLTSTPYAETPPWTTAATGSGSAVNTGHATAGFGFDMQITGFSGLTPGGVAMLRYNQLEFVAEI